MTLQHVTRDNNVTRAGMQSSSLLIHGDCPDTGGTWQHRAEGDMLSWTCMDMDGMCYNIHIPFLGIGLSLTNNKCQLFTNLVLGGIKCKWIFQQFTMMDSCYSLLDPCL